MSDITLRYGDATLSVMAGESVLDSLLRQGVAIPHGCRAGVCQSCLMVAEAGTLNERAQQGLSATQQQQGLFLSCQCYPESDLTLSGKLEQHLWNNIQIDSADWLSPSIYRLRLSSRLYWKAGQYVTISLNRHVARSFSVASSALVSETLELHIRCYDDGALSLPLSQLCGAQHVNNELWIKDPLGQCIYQPDTSPLLLIGQGTGLAPFRAMLQEIDETRHTTLIGLTTEADLDYWQYIIGSSSLTEERLDAEHIVSGPNQLSAVGDSLKRRFDGLRGCAIYIFGHAEFVSQMRRLCAMHGASASQIHHEAFLNFRPDQDPAKPT